MTKHIQKLLIHHRTTCALCESSDCLMESHIIPKFVSHWLKETSATGYLRDTISNKRLQDGYKIKLLCHTCEQKFEKFETPFAEHIFYKYVGKILDPSGVGSGTATLPYKEWLLNFIVSVQWRTIQFRKAYHEDFGKNWRETIFETEQIWRQFLLGKRSDTGKWEHHIIFLHNVEDAGIPQNLLPNQINSYLLGSIDYDYAASTNKLAQFTKLGPVLIWSYLKPHKSIHMNDSRVRLNGQFNLPQQLYDPTPLKFIITKRPLEVSAVIKTNDSVIERVKRSFQQDPERAVNSMTFRVRESDNRIEDSKDKKK